MITIYLRRNYSCHLEDSFVLKYIPVTPRSCCPQKLYCSLPVQVHQQYRPSEQVLGVEPEAHIYWTAQLATSRRAAQKTDQVVVVTGESGAGKTEATKLMIKHILYLSEHRSETLPDNINKVLLGRVGRRGTLWMMGRTQQRTMTMTMTMTTVCVRERDWRGGDTN